MGGGYQLLMELVWACKVLRVHINEMNREREKRNDKNTKRD